MKKRLLWIVAASMLIGFQLALLVQVLIIKFASDETATAWLVNQWDDPAFLVLGILGALFSLVIDFQKAKKEIRSVYHKQLKSMMAAKRISGILQMVMNIQPFDNGSKYAVVEDDGSKSRYIEHDDLVDHIKAHYPEGEKVLTKISFELRENANE